MHKWTCCSQAQFPACTASSARLLDSVASKVPCEVPCASPVLQLAQRWFFGYVYGRSTSLLSKMAGAADLTLIPAAHLALKVSAELCQFGTVV